MDALHLVVKEKAVYWRLRAKVRFALEGDENIKFFHASATCRLRRNSIAALDVDGTPVTTHAAKATILKNFFGDLLGSVTLTNWWFRADPSAASCLRDVLEDFAATTGLAINIHKSCFIPRHVSTADECQMAATLGCPVSSFPQPYLGLPLSPTKLPISAYAPLILSFDRRLSGWQALLLSSGGRLVLCNVVLNNLASYYMRSYLLPQGVLESIDKRCRAFFWMGKDSCSGARYLIAWHKVLLSKQEGGFGVKDPHRQNRCLLLNFIHKLHQADSLPWKDWFRQHSGQDLGDSTSSPSFLDKIVRERLPLYRCITRATGISGTSTAFWLDKWIPDKPLAKRYPALFSHVTRPNASVAVVGSTGLALQPRLTTTTERQIQEVLGIDQYVCQPLLQRLCAIRRVRCLPLAGDRTTPLLRLLHRHRGVGSPSGPIPADDFSIWDLPPAPGTATHIWHAGLATVMWSLWKARNDLVFNAKATTARMVLRRAADDLALWSFVLSPPTPLYLPLPFCTNVPTPPFHSDRTSSTFRAVVAPKREFEPSANDHEAGSSRRAAPAAFDMGPSAPIRDRIYVTVAVAQMFWEADVPMSWGDVHLPTAGT
ncbi:hypothetical protein QYE76_052103 [Lolium multiflorum]|uniref:Uncharacterized protein n=1 Tax=Lolium multiflorum TaxID=4521 RepID=A0AAD8SUB4_LOLMU|nr:hypothetical protein QYE76_052103 [Lolium multiflorum]